MTAAVETLTADMGRGAAAVQLVDRCWTEDTRPTGPTLDVAMAAVGHLVANKKDLPMVAYLACQVVGYQRSANQNALLAMSQIGSIVREYSDRQRVSA